MRPWIAVAYSAPVAAATAVFIIYPIGQGSFSDGYQRLALLGCYPSLLNTTFFLCCLTLLFLLTSNLGVIFLAAGNPFWLSPYNNKRAGLHAQDQTSYAGFDLASCAQTRHVLAFASKKASPGPGGGKNKNNKGPNPTTSHPNQNPYIGLGGKVIGQPFPFFNIKTGGLPPSPAIYCIHCKSANQYYIGECKNFKELLNILHTLKLGCMEIRDFSLTILESRMMLIFVSFLLFLANLLRNSNLAWIFKTN
jgi:hypothetical protein